MKEVAQNLNDLISKNWLLSRLINTPMETDGLQNYNFHKFSKQQVDYEDKTPESTKRYNRLSKNIK